MDKGKMLAVITGADGGMGREIVSAVAKAGYHVIMACLEKESGEKCLASLDCGAGRAEVLELNLESFDSIRRFAGEVKAKGEPVALLANNAGVLCWNMQYTADGLERTVGVNYAGPFLLTSLLLPLMVRGSRIVNTISCTYMIGRVGKDPFFRKGEKFWRFPFYSDSKLMLTLFTLELSRRLADAGISVNASDPGIVNTNIIRQGNIVVDKLADWFFRPVIYSPRKGASTAVRLLLDETLAGETGAIYSACKKRRIPSYVRNNRRSGWLWTRSSEITGADMSSVCRNAVAEIKHQNN